VNTLSRTARVLLLLSIALNVALATALVSYAPWKHGGRDPRHGGPVPGLLDLRAFRRSLPEARQAIVETAFAAHRDALRPRLGALFAARRAVREAIRAEPFDRATLDAAFAALRAAETEAATEAQALLGDVLVSATPEERRRLAELMPRRMVRERGPRHGRDDGHERDARGDADPAPAAGD
jgi:Spy/CpxP family protein refolding chaperone